MTPRTSAGLPPAVAIFLAVTAAGFADAPQWRPTTSLQHQTVTLGKTVTLDANATGTAPLSYQWLVDGCVLAGQTNKTLIIRSAQPSDEGDYTVRVTNGEGEARSIPARVWVVPPSASFSHAEYTNSGGGRMPYSYLLPTNYTPAQTYPLVCFCVGLPDPWGSEGQWQQYTDSGFDFYKVCASYRQQVANPVVMVWLGRPTGQSSWDANFARHIPEFIGEVSARFSIDTNRVYAIGGGEPVPAIIETIRLGPDLLAGAVFYVPLGTQNISVTPVKHIPIWNLTSAADGYAPVAVSRQLIDDLRRAGNPAIYTEFATATHPADLFTMMSIPAMVDWLLAQRRGATSRADPLLVISEPTEELTYATGAASLSLAGSAQALSESITAVKWEALLGKGNASGTNPWTAANIPLAPDTTNTVIVTATATSWAPAYGGNTTFSGTLFVLSRPIRASLTWQPGGAVLNWTGSVAPFKVQKASRLTADWKDLVTNAAAPLPVTLDGPTGFYRIIGR